jgi:hypothetical protein
MVLQTPAGNVLWDLIAFLDDATVQWVRMRLSASRCAAYPLKIESLGGLQAIVISHPHYYDIRGMVEDIQMPVYTSEDDNMWLDRLDALAQNGD